MHPWCSLPAALITAEITEDLHGLCGILRQRDAELQGGASLLEMKSSEDTALLRMFSMKKGLGFA